MNTTHMKPYGLIGLIVLFMFLAFGGNSQSYQLYGIVGNYLVTINPATGAATEVAQLSPSYPEMHRLAYVPGLDKLYTVVDWQSNPRLASIDRCTGEVTIVGFIDQLSPPLDIRLIEGLTYNPDNGMLYASGHETAPPANVISNKLMTINPANGNAVVVATITGTCQNEADDLAFTSGAYYSMDACSSNRRIYSINLTTGSSTFIGSNTSSASRTTVHPATGVYYAGSPADRKLYSVSTTNGAVTMIGQMYNVGDFGGGSLLGLAFAPEGLDSDGDEICDSSDNCPDTQNPGQEDEDCDGVGNTCDLCPGGDDSVDNNNDGLADCAYPPHLFQILPDWKCGNYKVYICHNNTNTLCISYFALAPHIAHGDYLGPCGSAPCGGSNLSALPDNSLAGDQAQTGLQIFPNPAEGEFQLVFGEPIPENAIVSVISMEGKTVLTIPLVAGELDQLVSVSELPVGVYTVKVTVDELPLWEEKLVKQ